MLVPAVLVPALLEAVALVAVELVAPVLVAAEVPVLLVPPALLLPALLVPVPLLPRLDPPAEDARDDDDEPTTPLLAPPEPPVLPDDELLSSDPVVGQPNIHTEQPNTTPTRRVRIFYTSTGMEQAYLKGNAPVSTKVTTGNRGVVGAKATRVVAMGWRSCPAGVGMRSPITRRPHASTSLAARCCFPGSGGDRLW